MISKTDQIEALLHHKAYDVATATLGISHMCKSPYSKVFNVTRDDIDNYVAEHGLPGEAFCTVDGPHMCEGIHLVKRDKTWRLFWLERGIASGEETFQSEIEAKHRLLDWILNTAGTGIDFTHWDRTSPRGEALPHHRMYGSQ